MALSTLKRLSNYAGLARQSLKLRRADDETVRRAARRHLVERMGRMRGLPQKLGQLLSFSRDDNDAADDYALLQESAEPLPFEIIEPLLESAWGRPIDQVVASIEPHAHAASLGQVHRAVLGDGTPVAVKVQYPNLRQTVHADLKLLGWLSIPVGNLRRGFDLTGYRQVILDDLERELDYRQEADEQRAFSAWAEAEPFLVVPRVIDELSTDNVLVSRWEEGDAWDKARDAWTPDEKRFLAAGLLRLFLDGLFRRGQLHADWHPGNLRFRRAGGRVQLVLYDYGCVFRPTDEQRLTLARLIRATIRGDESPWPLFIKLGFSREHLAPLADRLPALCRVLFEPFTAEHPYDLADWRLGERVGDVLGDDRWNLRIAGPPALIFLMRALHGLTFYLEGLKSPLMWQRVMLPILETLRPDLDRLELPGDAQRQADFRGLAKYLKIRVREAGRTKVELTAYASSIDHLSELIDDELQAKIRSRGLGLDQLVADVRRRAYAPGPVFELKDGEKEVHVWLE